MKDLNTILDELLDSSSALEGLSLGEQFLLLGILGAVFACILFAFCWDGDYENNTQKEIRDETTIDLAPDSSQVGRSLYGQDPIVAHQSNRQTDSTAPESTKLPIPSPSSATKIIRTPTLVSAGRNLYLVGVMFVVTWAMFSVILAASRRWLRK